MAKYKLNLERSNLGTISKFIFLRFLKLLFPKNKINNLNELENFIQTKSAWVTQVTLYGLFKDQNGHKICSSLSKMMKFMSSVNLAKVEYLFCGSSRSYFFSFFLF